MPRQQQHHNIITSFQPPRADEMILPNDGIGVKLQAQQQAPVGRANREHIHQ